MLIRFSVSNFLSFDEETVFDMLASSSEEHPNHVGMTGNVRVVKNAAIYGANGSGKSNLVLAINKFVEIIEKGKLSENINTYKFKLNPKNKDLPVKFEMEFSIGNAMYIYGIECNHKTIEHEWLIDTTNPDSDELLLNRKTLGSRSYDIEFCHKWNETPEQKSINAVLEKNLLRDDELIVHHHETLRIDELSRIVNYLNVNIVVITKVKTLLSFFQFLRSLEDITAVSGLIEKFDTGIHSIAIEEIPLENILSDYSSFIDKYKLSITKEDLNQIQGISSDVYHPIRQDAAFFNINDKIVFRQILFEHKDIHNNNVGFLFEIESDGTQRIIELLPVLLSNNSKNTVFVIDEIDNSLHPNLCYEFVKLLVSDRKENSQIIFTTHQPNLLTRELFRDDEIWFVEKDRHKGNTSLYPLFEFDVKADFNLEDGYLLGRFGGVPLIDTHTSM